MFKRVTIVALVVAAFVLMLAVPAFAFNGMRADYTTVDGCNCHTGFSGIPTVTPSWADTKHAVAGVDNQASRLPYGSVCQGCHTANFDPAKVIPTPTATSTSGSVSWGVANGTPAPATQTTGDAASSENFVGCSSCHYGTSVGGIYGVDSNNTAHNSPYGQLANADICGACHSRYSYTVDTYSVSPVPYVKVTTGGTPVPNPNPTTLIQPQMAIGYPMLGSPSPSPAVGWDPAAPLSAYLNTQTPGWTPTPTATKAGFASLQTYWQDADGNTLPWQQSGHDGSAAQYPDWAISGHAASLTTLTSQPFWNSFPESTKQECLECHSADFRILKADGENPTSSDVQYGLTCVGCHSPHDAGTVKGAWDEEFDAQLINDSSLHGNGSNLCTECHTDQLPAGQQAVPGTVIHNAQKEIMAGYGAIGVKQMPGVHEGKCIQCHMPPTSYSRGSAQLGANHTMMIIDPDTAADASPVPITTTTPTPSGSPVVTMASMPFSSCSTCHGRASDPDATYLQGTIEQRQTWTKDQISQLNTELDAAAVILGYTDASAAQAALVAVPQSQWTTSQAAFLAAWTNTQFLSSDGSYGIHNWAYTNQIAGTAQDQVKAVTAPTPRKWVISLRASRSSVNKNKQQVYFRGAVQTGWGIAAKGTVTLQRRMAGQSWRDWKSQTLATNGSYSIVQKLNFTKGKWYFRTVMPGDGGLNLTNNSHNVVVTVK
jgi:hypothetical protein